MSIDPVVPVPVLVVSGPVGVGKSTVLAEMHDLLAAHQVPHAYIERDALAWSWPPRGYFNEDAVRENLAALWANFRAAGAERLAIAGVVERAADLDVYRSAVPGARVTVCHLAAPEPTRVARLRGRELGAGLDWHLRRTVELERILDTVQLHDFSVSNDDRPVADVAREILFRAGWLSDQPPADRSPG